MAKTAAHKHTFDLTPDRPIFFESPRVVCTICRFGVPLHMLASTTSLESIVARKNATPAVREALAKLGGGK
jgi:hypothetical protein